MICYKPFFTSFEISVGAYNIWQITLGLIKEFAKCILSFMENLIALFIQFFSTFANFYFYKEYWAVMRALNFVTLVEFLHLLGPLITREVPRTFSL